MAVGDYLQSVRGYLRQAPMEEKLNHAHIDGTLCRVASGQDRVHEQDMPLSNVFGQLLVHQLLRHALAG